MRVMKLAHFLLAVATLLLAGFVQPFGVFRMLYFVNTENAIDD